MSNTFHACPNCNRAGIPDELYVCAACWRKVPENLRVRLYTAYKRGRGLGTDALARAQQAVLQHLRKEESDE